MVHASRPTARAVGGNGTTQLPVASVPLASPVSDELDEIDEIYSILIVPEAEPHIEEDIPPAKIAEIEAEVARSEAEIEHYLERALNAEGLSTDDPVRLYLREIGRTPLLKALDEADLAQRIEAGKRASAILHSSGNDSVAQPWMVDLPELPRVQMVFSNDNRNLIAANGRSLRELEACVNDGRLASQQLVQANLRLVVSIARRYINRGLNLLDLIQEGNIGLIRASDKFDHRKGYKFSTYATWWIRQAITRAISDQSRTIRLPVHVSETISRLKKASHDLQQRLQREPSELEIAAEMGLTLAKVQRIIEIAKHPVSIDTPLDENEDSFLGDLIEDQKVATPMEEATQRLLKEQIDAVLQNLSERERQIIVLRFGLNDGHYRTLEEVAKEFNITRERIRQIEAKILRKLRHSRYGGSKLKAYLELD
ncbi:MAG: RNA polymerase subunit sigma [Candidatus Chloroheliales bacterium]|nr:MAG: RNA polymerase subunit sigma [Chloroflexota bacterium]